MSRIGKKIIDVPEGVNVAISESEILTTGPKGELKRLIEDRSFREQTIEERLDILIDKISRILYLLLCHHQTSSYSM